MTKYKVQSRSGNNKFHLSEWKDEAHATFWTRKDAQNAINDNTYMRNNGLVWEFQIVEVETVEDRRWGVWFAGPHEYASKEEAEKQLFLAQMDVPARLIYNTGDGWRDATGGNRLGKAGFADDIRLVEDYSRGHLPENIGGAVVTLMGKLEAIEGLLEQRKRVMADFKDREKKAFDAGDSALASKYGIQHRAVRREVGRLERILYDEC